jgi:multiple sugar transport system permease protein
MTLRPLAQRGVRPARSRTALAATSPGRLRRSQSRAAFVLIAPFAAIFLAAILIPLGYGFVLSLFTEQRSGLGIGDPVTVFVGLGNYLRVLADPAFQKSFGTLLLYCGLYVPIIIVVPLALALFIDAGYRWVRRVVPVLIFLPHAVPGMLAAIIWAYLYTPAISPVLRALGDWGAQATPFANHGVLIPSLVNIAAWEWIGYNLVIYFTALQALDRSMLEAARVDGAGPFRIAWSIKTPLVGPTTFVVTLFAVIGALQLFTEPTLLRQSDPTISSTLSPAMYAYLVAFVRNDYGAGVAASLLLALLGAVLSFGLTRLGRRWGVA